MYALRERRVHVTQEDFEMAVAKVCNVKDVLPLVSSNYNNSTPNCYMPCTITSGFWLPILEMLSLHGCTNLISIPCISVPEAC